MTSPIGSTNATTNTTTSGSTAATTGGAMDKQAFLKLLVAQIGAQDPMKPMEGTEFVAQLSQFAVVEQAIAQSNKLEILTAQVRGLSNNEAAGLVGKAVTVRGHAISFDGSLATSTSVTLGAASTKTTATVRDANGNVVRTIDLGPKPAGALTVPWDGRDESGNMAPKGTYTIEVQGTGPNGEAVNVTQDVTGVVTKVSYEKGYPELTLDSGATVPISDLVSVGATPATR